MRDKDYKGGGGGDGDDGSGRRRRSEREPTLKMSIRRSGFS